jgi:hypothetical protein
MQITINIEGYEADKIAGKVIDQLAGNLESEVREAITEQTTAIVARVAGQQADAIVAAAIDEALREGWQRTNLWGEPVGGKITLKERIVAALHSADNYNSGRDFITKFAKDATEKTLREEFKSEIEDARKAFRAAVDEMLNAKLRESLRATLGLGS